MKISINNLSGYLPGTSIPNAIKKHLDKFYGKLLDFGCGSSPYKNLLLTNSNITKYIGLDIENSPLYKNSVDLLWNGITIPLENNSINTIIATEVFEHIPDLEKSLKEIYRVLQDNGLIFFTVPFLWPLHDIPYDEYRYTPFSLNRHLENVGFKKINIKALGGWDASLAQMLGLWVNLRPLNPVKRKILQYLLRPIIKILINKDMPMEKFNQNHLMFTGLYGIAYK